MNIIKDILYHRRQFFIDKVQKPLLDNILKLANLYPEPTNDNVVWNNTRILIKVFDEIIEYGKKSGRVELFKALKRLVVDKTGVDGFYDFISVYALKRLNELGYNYENRGFPMWRYWNGPLVNDTTKESDPTYNWEEKMMRKKLGEI